MIFFVILSGTKNTAPLNSTYFLQADTSGITGARAISQWTYFYVCGANNVDCTKASPAMPFGHAWADDAENIPDGIGGSFAGNTTSKFYFYMWRFGWVFYIISLFFAIAAFFTGFLACCGRLGSAISGLVSLTALFFYSVAVSLMTCVVYPNSIHLPSFSILHANHPSTVPPSSRLETLSSPTVGPPRLASTHSASAGAPGQPCSSRRYCSSSARGPTGTPHGGGADPAALGAAGPMTWVRDVSRRITLNHWNVVPSRGRSSSTRCIPATREESIMMMRLGNWMNAHSQAWKRGT